LAAWLVVALGRDGLQDILDVWPGLLVTTGHDRGTITSSLLTAGDTGTDEAESLLGKVAGAAVGIGEMRVAAINDDVTLLNATICARAMGFSSSSNSIDL
jgi:hypothetical protein